MKPEEIEKAVVQMDEATKIRLYEANKKKFRLYINGGYEGLEVMYYNYMREQKIPVSETQRFENYINENEPKELFLNQIFYEVDNYYVTNIGVYVYGLCSLISEDRNKDLESKKVEIYQVIKRLEQEIAKSAGCTIGENAKVYIIVKKVEDYYRTMHTHLIEDFAPYLLERNIASLTPKTTANYIVPKDTLSFKIGLLFYTGEIKMMKGIGNPKFIYQERSYNSGNSLAKILAPVLNEKENSIKPYLNETYNNSLNDKNVFYSTKLKNEIINYCHIHQKQIYQPQDS